ncbi:PiggyBac transposable element-derived protein 4 [Araneus ventricosus]|uniref:PiggyBac transposable element-derived protein 4 n=1 Tax=Araneus ventricosus TaxID=182803 RepID=A0A4Y2NI76_ARAVE|nr:PiggyBac transposable element-derived protein 4 [Araneus ventricosus]
MPLWNESPNYKSTTNIVMALLEDLLDKGYYVTLDNFYTSPELAELLLSHRTDVYGTLRPNRIGVPEEIKKSTLKKGEIVGFQKGKICVMKYMDKKPICILSTVHNTIIVEHDKKRKKTHGKSERIVSKKLQAIIDYNLTMGGVDKADQCLSYYATVRNQQKKYYLKIFRQILNQSVWNSFVLYKKNRAPCPIWTSAFSLLKNWPKYMGNRNILHKILHLLTASMDVTFHLTFNQHRKRKPRQKYALFAVRSLRYVPTFGALFLKKRKFLFNTYVFSYNCV